MPNARMLTLLYDSRGWSGTELANRSGVPQPTISKMEKGLAALDPERIQQIADALDYPVAAFD